MPGMLSLVQSWRFQKAVPFFFFCGRFFAFQSGMLTIDNKIFGKGKSGTASVGSCQLPACDKSWGTKDGTVFIKFFSHLEPPPPTHSGPKRPCPYDVIDITEPICFALVYLDLRSTGKQFIVTADE